MSNELVVPVKSGVSVLGVEQYEFVVDGVGGRTLAQAVGVSNIRRAVAIEEGANAYSVILRARQAKCEELSELMVIIAGTYAAYDVAEPEEKYYVDEDYELTDYSTFSRLMNKYNIPRHDWSGTNVISAASMDRIKTEIEYMTDKETTQIQEETTLLQYYLGKRDSSYSTASKMMAQVNTSTSASIAYILG